MMGQGFGDALARQLAWRLALAILVPLVGSGIILWYAHCKKLECEARPCEHGTAVLVEGHCVCLEEAKR